jgi:hypothetical protein
VPLTRHGGKRRWIVALPFIALATLDCSAALAEQAAAYCKRAGTDDTLRPVPLSLAPLVTQVFGLTMPAEVIARTSYFRCLDGQVLACTVGANLPCGKANTSRSLPAVADYCRANPGAESVPMFVTGHDTIYQWHCAGDAAVAGGAAEQLDPRGFFVRYWRRLP